MAIKKEMKAAHTQAKKALQKKDLTPRARVKLSLAVLALEHLGKTKPWGCFQPMFINF